MVVRARASRPTRKRLKPRVVRAVPVRTCVGCRERAPKSSLLRIASLGSALVVDVRGQQPGRGAHLHPDQGCLDLAHRRRAFSRALRLDGQVDSKALVEFLSRTAVAPVTGGAPNPEGGVDTPR